MIYLKDLRDATGGQMFGDVHATQYARFATDPLKVRPGDLYIATSVDSNRAIQQAIHRGAAGIVVEDPPIISTESQTVVMVGDARAAMGQWAAYVLRQFGTTVIGVFTAVGEATMQAAIAAVLGERYNVFSYSYLPNQTEVPFALPDAVQNLTPEHEILIMPLLGQRPTHLADVVAAAQPLVNVVGRITPIEPISEAELARIQGLTNVVVEQLPGEGRAVINADDYVAQEAVNRGILAPSVLYGQTPDIYADVRAEEITWLPNRSTFTLGLNEETYSDISINFPGPFAIDAALAAISTGYLFDMTLPEMLPALAHIRLPDHLTHIRRFLNEHLLLDFSGESSFTSIISLLNWLSALDIPQQRKAVWMGDIHPNFPELYAAEVTVGAADRVMFEGAVAKRLANPLLQSGMLADKVDMSFLTTDSASLLEKHLPRKSAILKVGLFAEGLRHTDNFVNQVEVDLTQLKANLATIQSRIKPESKLIVDISDNAYGHGLLAVASTALAGGARALSVHSLEEGVRLRELGVSVPIFTTANLSQQDLLLAAANRLHVTLKTPDTVELIREISWQIDQPILAQVLMDVDAGWFGIEAASVVRLVRKILRVPGIKLEGVYSAPLHADDLLSIAKTREKLRLFEKIVKSLTVSGINLVYVHADVSSGMFSLPEADFGWVNPGSVVYGLNVSSTATLPAEIKPTLTWKTTVSQVSEPESQSANAKQPAGKIAIIPLGFRDGLASTPFTWGEVLLNGRRVKVLKDASAHASALDVSSIPDVSVGDEVVLLGTQARERILAEDVARRISKPVDVLLADIPERITRSYR